MIALPALVFGVLVATIVPDGLTAYRERCATCHGANLEGGANAPTLRGVGSASLDFWMSTGRMPAAVPWIEIDHHDPQLSQSERNAIVAYVMRVAPGGVAIPRAPAGGDPERGRARYRAECMGCHGATATGAAIGGNEWAPELARASPVQIAEAIRIGPRPMPVFGTHQVSSRDVADIVAFLLAERAAARPHAPPYATSGPVPEGLLGWLVAAALAVAAYAFSAMPRRA